MTTRRVRVRGTLLSEVYSSPSGAFEVHGFLSVEKDRLVLSRRDKAAWMRKLVVPFARVTESRVEAGRVYVEWRTDDGVISGLDLALDEGDKANVMSVLGDNLKQVRGELP